MNKELIISDPKALALRDEMSRRLDERVAQLEFLSPQGAKVASTIMTVRRWGGIGATLAGLTLEYLANQTMLYIEVGGAPSLALKARGAADYLHFPSSDPRRVENAMDARLSNASRPAIIEFEPAFYADTLPLAARFRQQFSPCNLAIFYIAGTYDPHPKYIANAYNRGINDVILCLQASQSWEDEAAGFIRLPWIDDSIVSLIMRNSLSLADALKQTQSLWSANMTRAALQAFGTELWRAGK